MIVEGDNPEGVFLAAQWAANRISSWVTEAGLMLSPQKSVVVLFIRSLTVRDFLQDEDSPRLMILDGVEIPWSS